MAIAAGTFLYKHLPNKSSNEPEYIRQIAITVNNILQGKTQNTGEFTLTASSTSTVVIDARCTEQSVILPMAKTANAAQHLQNCYFNPTSGSFTITHNNLPHTDATFNYAIIG